MSAHARHRDEPIDGQHTGEAVQAAIRARVGFYDAMPVGQSQFAQRDTRLALLEKELEGINTTLAGLQRRRNLLIYASGSPPEVLSTIFHFLADIEPNYYPNSEDYLYVVKGKLLSRLGWMKVTQWATEMLRLSGTLPISLDLCSLEKLQQGEISPLSLIAEQANRLSQLQIMCDKSGEKQLRDIFMVSLPLLMSLRVFVRQNPSMYTQDQFSTHYPLLRELYLHNVDVPWSYFPGERLTRLTLSLYPSTFIGVHSVQQLVEVISCLPELEYICVKNRGSEFTDADIISAASAPPIPCPRLTDVILHLFSAPAAVLAFCRLSVHPDARVSLAGLLRSSLSSAPRERAVLHLFQQRMAKDHTLAAMQTIEWRSHGVQRFSLDEDRVATLHARTLTLSAWRENHSDYLLADYAGYPTPPTPHFRLTLSFSQDSISNVDPGDVLRWQELFPSARSVSLQPACRFPLEVRSWKDIFEGFPQLEWLRADRQIAESLLRDNGKVPQSIKTLALLCVHWGDPDIEDVDEVGAEAESSVDLQMLKIWQKTRKGGGELAEIIVGSAPSFGAAFALCVLRSDIKRNSVERPEWLVEGHEDWDAWADW